MDSLIQLSKIADFLYCPLSLYLHTLYEDIDTRNYQEVPQVAGTIAHASIDEGTYSSAKRFLLGMGVYSEAFGITGKIDVYDFETHALIERKRQVKQIYEGNIAQLYGQYFCMKEMGYRVDKLFIHSLIDNKRYPIPLPGQKEMDEFVDLLRKIREVTPEDLEEHSCPRCTNHIYSPLSWKDPIC